MYTHDVYQVKRQKRLLKQKNIRNIWYFQNKPLPLHSLLRNNALNIGSVAQLNRASDYGSEGCRFESCRSHKAFPKGLHKKLNLEKRMLIVNILFFLVCSARALSNGWKSRVSPNSGNYIAQGKGVHCEVKSERSQRQTSDLTYRNSI